MGSSRTVAIACAVIVFGSLGHAGVIFDNRQNVSVLQSEGVSITSDVGAVDASSLRWRSDYEAGYWENGAPGSGTKTTLTFDLGGTRNVKTLRMFDYYAAYLMTDTTLRTSATGLPGSWTVVPSSTTMPSAKETRIALTNAADTRYLQVTGDAYQDANNRVVLEQILAYGDTGASLDPGLTLDLVASSGFSAAGAVTLSQVGGNLVGTLATMADDNPSSTLDRRVLWSFGTGDYVTIEFDRDIAFGSFGFAAAAGHVDTSSSFRFNVWGSADGTTYDTLLLDQTGGVQYGANIYSLLPFTGKALKFEILNSNTADLRYNDFMVFQVPEPAAIAVFALGTVALITRLVPRRRADGVPPAR